MWNRYGAPPTREREEKTQEKPPPPQRDRDDRHRDNDGPGIVFLPDVVSVVSGSRRHAPTPGITFVRARRNGPTELCTVDDQGIAAIPCGTAFDGATDPSRARRSGRLAYVKSDGGRAALWVADARLRKPRRISRPEWGDAHEPAWSPDEKRIAFVIERDGSTILHTVRADGKQLSQVGAIGKLNRQPIWSRDGRWLIFVAGVDGGTALFRVASSGGEPQRLPGVPGNPTTDPALSPDGRLLAYVLDGRTLCLADPGSGALQRRLVDSDGAKMQPSFHPTQPRLVYAGSRDGVFAIHEVRLTDGDVRRLSPGNDDETCPTWW